MSEKVLILELLRKAVHGSKLQLLWRFAIKGSYGMPEYQKPLPKCSFMLVGSSWKCCYKSTWAGGDCTWCCWECNKIIATLKSLHLLKSCAVTSNISNICSNICEVLLPEETDWGKAGSLGQLYPEVTAECRRGVGHCRVFPWIKQVGSSFPPRVCSLCEHRVEENLL